MTDEHVDGFSKSDGGGETHPDHPEADNVRSYALLSDEVMRLYMNFYKKTYGKGVFDRKTKEFIAIAASLTSGCKNCLEGHLKKAIQHGATHEEISEVITIAMTVNAATIVDRSDIAASNMNLDRSDWLNVKADPGEDQNS